MSYEETLHYLYTSIPVFQHSGASAYKPGLGTSIELDDMLGNPHKSYKTIHVGGTNGKGSTSHLLAAILQSSGYRVGLYTSPHLIDFRERIRVNGEMIPKDFVIEFVEKHRSFFEPLHPSFFELTSAMAMDYFRQQGVDFAIIEVGLGGRLDSTNIISPLLSVITNISLDHTQYLGDTVEKIAFEKAGIIKNGIPALLGEADNESVLNVFKDRATEVKAPFFFAQEMGMMNDGSRIEEDGKWFFTTSEFGEIKGELGGEVQLKNANTVLSAIHILNELYGLNIKGDAVADGFATVTSLTGLMGRWQTLHESPKVICDTGHNIGGWQYLAEHLELMRKSHNRLFMVVGMVNDKDINGVLSLMPKGATYLFTQAAIERAMPAEDFAKIATEHGLEGTTYKSVKEAVKKALLMASANDLIFIGGSTFIVAEALPLFTKDDKQE